MNLKLRNDLDTLREPPLEFQELNSPNDDCFDNKIKLIIPDVSKFSNGNVNQWPVKKSK